MGSITYYVIKVKSNVNQKSCVGKYIVVVKYLNLYAVAFLLHTVIYCIEYKLHFALNAQTMCASSAAIIAYDNCASG